MTRITPKKLKDVFPQIAEWFHSEKNVVSLDQVTSGSSKRIWWKCPKEHVFLRSVTDMVNRGASCNYCSGRLASPENNLRVHYPQLADMFDKGDNGMLATEVTVSGTKKVNWKCLEGHDFKKSVYETVKTGGMCRECNSLSFRFPHIFVELSSKNTFDTTGLSFGSNKNVLWECLQGHEWKTAVHKRTGRGDGCPTCSGRYASAESNLLVHRPDVAAYFDEVKTGKPATEFRPSSNQNVWWKCDKGHSYDMSPNKKIAGLGCPFCSGYRVDETNSLSSLFPLIAEEFMSQRNGVTPDSIPAGRSVSYWWKCKAQGHEWTATVGARTMRNSGCPYCYGRYATENNNLLLVKPKDAAQFDVKKNGVTPDKVSPHSNTPYWWRCEEGHSWNTYPNAKKGCPQCSMSRSSKIEEALRVALHEEGLALSLERNYVIPIQWRRNKSMAIDVMCAINGHKVVIEYDGNYYHSGAASNDPSSVIQRDIDKTHALLDAGYKVVRVREESSLGKLFYLNISHPHLMQVTYKYNQGLAPNTFFDLIEAIKEWAGKF